jgi:hypothetical protein
MDNIDDSEYEDNEETVQKIFYIRKALYARLELKRNNVCDIEDYLLKQKRYTEEECINIIVKLKDFYFYNDTQVDDGNIIETDNFINSLQKFNVMFNSADSLERILLKYKENNYDTIEEIANDFTNVISNTYQNIKTVNSITSDYLDDFNSNDEESFNSVLSNFKKKFDSPAHKLKTMVKTRNQFLSGGYEAGMCYCILGLSGKGKSIELQNIALDIKEANADLEYVSSKKSVILYISQENNIYDFLRRAFSYYGIDKDENGSLNKSEVLKNKSAMDLHAELKEKTNFCKGPELQFKFRRSKSISTEYIEKCIEEVEREGDKKVICVIHDYIGLIKAATPNNNSYEDLGTISREFCDIAKVYNLPVITAQQFNRKASEIVEEALKKGKTNVLDLLNGSHIADSNQIFYNTNCIYSILKKKDPITGNMVMSYNMLKDRSDDGSTNINHITKFSHPFDENGFRLKPDLNLVENYSILNEGDGLESKTVKNLRTKKNRMVDKDSELSDRIKNIKEALDDDSDDEE